MELNFGVIQMLDSLRIPDMLLISLQNISRGFLDYCSPNISFIKKTLKVCKGEKYGDIGRENYQGKEEILGEKIVSFFFQYW